MTCCTISLIEGNVYYQKQINITEAFYLYLMFSFFVWIVIRKKVYGKGILVRELTDKQKTTFFNANVTVVITIKHRKGKKTWKNATHIGYFIPHPKCFFTLLSLMILETKFCYHSKRRKLLPIWNAKILKQNEKMFHIVLIK